jgi:hypothetical protein
MCLSETAAVYFRNGKQLNSIHARYEIPCLNSCLNLFCALYNILGELGWGDVDWIGLAKDRNR